MPSAVRPSLFWKAMTAASVPGPNLESMFAGSNPCSLSLLWCWPPSDPDAPSSRFAILSPSSWLTKPPAVGYRDAALSEFPWRAYIRSPARVLRHPWRCPPSTRLNPRCLPPADGHQRVGAGGEEVALRLLKIGISTAMPRLPDGLSSHRAIHATNPSTPERRAHGCVGHVAPVSSGTHRSSGRAPHPGRAPSVPTVSVRLPRP